MNVDLTKSDAALIVGGTGMLADATLHVVRRAGATTIVSRNHDAARALGLDANSICIADWRRFEQFTTAVSATFAARKPTLAVLWIHADGARTLVWLLQQLRSFSTFIVHVLGSTAPTASSRAHESEAAPPTNYVTVRLGSKLGANRTRRWLSHEEISAGVIEAIERRRDVIVGDLIGVA